MEEEEEQAVWQTVASESSDVEELTAGSCYSSTPSR